MAERYIHKKTGNEYWLLVVTNEHAVKASMPPTAVYYDSQNRNWSRPLEEFNQKFEKAGD